MKSKEAFPKHFVLPRTNQDGRREAAEIFINLSADDRLKKSDNIKHWTFKTEGKNIIYYFYFVVARKDAMQRFVNVCNKVNGQMRVYADNGICVELTIERK